MVPKNLSCFHQFNLLTEGNWEKGLCYKVEWCTENKKTSKHVLHLALFRWNKLYSGCCNVKSVHCKAYIEEFVCDLAHVEVFASSIKKAPPYNRAPFYNNPQ